ncbi:MAG: MarR family EPS-associated transcriptional regulator [Sedimenticola sp.]
MKGDDLNLLRSLVKNPGYSQRQHAKEIGMSLGKLNYCLKKLVEKGWVKANNFRRSKNKMAYGYLLTPKGVEEKANLTVTFLRSKMHEYEQLRSEIELLKQEVNGGVGKKDAKL